MLHYPNEKCTLACRTHDGQAWRGEKEWGIRKLGFYYFSVLSMCLHFLTSVSKFQKLKPRCWRNTRWAKHRCTVPFWWNMLSLIHKHTSPYMQLQLRGAPNSSAGVLLIICGSLSLSVYVSVHPTLHLLLSSHSSSCTTQAVSDSLLVRQRKKSEAAHSLGWIL